MSTEFKLKDRVSIDKNLTFTTPRFGAVSEMREIFTGTVIRNPFQDEDEVIVMLDYPDDVPESRRISYSYDPRDLTLIPNTSNKKKGNTMSKLNKGDRVFINKSLKYTEERFSVVGDMKSIFSGVIRNIDEDRNKATITLDVSQNSWTYDLRDLTPYNTVAIPTNVKTSKNTTTVEFSDNTTTSVTKSAGDPYDLETAIAYCIAKKIVTNSCIKRLAKNAEEVNNKVDVDFYNKFLKPYGFLNENAYTDVEIETLKDYLKTLNDVRAEMALIAIENDLTKDELLGKLKG